MASTPLSSEIILQFVISRPAFSNRAIISPIRRARIASGLMRTQVVSMDAQQIGENPRRYKPLIFNTALETFSASARLAAAGAVPDR